MNDVLLGVFASSAVWIIILTWLLKRNLEMLETMRRTHDMELYSLKFGEPTVKDKKEKSGD